MTLDEHFRALTRLPNAELEKIFAGSQGPKPEAVAGWEWRGYNVPWFTRLLGIQKFIKGFFSGPGGCEGFNIPVVQNGIEHPWLPLPHPDSPKRFGFYRVEAGERTLLLDYGASARNPFYRPERVLRDYLVQPDPANPDLLLGKAYLALGPRVFSNFFVLSRLRPSSWQG